MAIDVSNTELVEKEQSVEIAQAECVGITSSPNSEPGMVSAQIVEKESLESATSNSHNEFDCDVEDSIRRKFAEKLRQNERPFFASSLLAFFIFTLTFGAIGSLVFIFWIAIAFALYSFSRTSTKYSIGVSDTEIQFKQDKQATFMIPWADIKAVRRTGSKSKVIILEMLPRRMSALKRIAFQNLFDYSWLSDKIVLNENDFSHPESAERFIRTLSERNKSVLIDESTSIASGASTDSQSSQLTASEKILDDKFFYNPFHSVQKRYSKFLKSFELLVLGSLMIVPIAALCFGGLSLCAIILTLMAILSIFGVLIVESRKVNLHFEANGLVIAWRNIAGLKQKYQKGQAIPWSKITRVYIQKCAAFQHTELSTPEESNSSTNKTASQNRRKRSSESPTIVLQFDQSGRYKNLELLRFIAPEIVRKRFNKLELHLDIANLPQEESRQQLYRLLRKNLEEEKIDPSVNEALNPTDIASYTKLWLDSFGASPQRRFEGNLTAGHQLKNGMFEIESFLGAGGQASVYLATQRPSTNQHLPEEMRSCCNDQTSSVVLKEFILPAHAGAEISQRSLEHIQKEFDLMKKLTHPNIVKYFDIFVEDHRCYLVLEHVDGKSLRAIVDDTGPLPESEVATLAETMAQILCHLHSQTPAVIHRDFTPENLILGKDGVLKLIDFNVAQELETESTNTIVGKHSYLPPEQFRGTATTQSDIYAFGASLYFMLTGEEPEPITCSHPVLKNESISASMDELVANSTQLELEDRIGSAEDLLCAIRHFRENGIQQPSND